MEMQVLITSEMLADAAYFALGHAWRPERMSFTEFMSDENLLHYIGHVAEALKLPSRMQIAAFAVLKVRKERQINTADVA